MVRVKKEQRHAPSMAWRAEVEAASHLSTLTLSWFCSPITCNEGRRRGDGEGYSEWRVREGSV